MSAEIKTTLGDGSLQVALKRLENTLAPGGDWTEANKRSDEWERQNLVESAKNRWQVFLKRGGLTRYAAEVSKMESTGSDAHRRFIGEYLSGFEKVFNRRVPGMFVSGESGIGKTFNAMMFCKNAMWAKDFQKTVKTEWAGKRYETRVPATCLYLTSGALVDALDAASRWGGQGKDSALEEICSHDIVIIDDVGSLNAVGKKNAEVAAVTRVMRAMPTGLILQTRLPQPDFDEIFGESAADMVRRYCKPYTAGCQSRRQWAKPGA